MFWQPAESLAAEPTRDGAKDKTKKIKITKKKKRGAKASTFFF
jgi:hypothetical protein